MKFLLVMFLFRKFTPQKTSDNCSKVELAKIIKMMGNEIWKTYIVSESDVVLKRGPAQSALTDKKRLVPRTEIK